MHPDKAHDDTVSQNPIINIKDQGMIRVLATSSINIGDEVSIASDLSSMLECSGYGDDLSSAFHDLNFHAENMRQAAMLGDEDTMRAEQLQAVKMHGWAACLRERLNRYFDGLENNAFYLKPHGGTASE